MRHPIRHPWFLIGALWLCSGCLENRTVDSNQPPIAEAGSDLQLDYEGSPVAVRLDGRDSSDPDGRIVTHIWRSGDDGPDGSAPAAALDPDDVARPALDLDPGSYTFTLWVGDDDGATSEPDSVTIRVGTDPVAECEAGLPAQFQNECGVCVCGVSDACRQRAAACDGTCWDLIVCIGTNCLDPSDFACITSSCAAFLGGAVAAMAFADAGCYEPCAETCAVPGGDPDAG
jgi:hypothetical protein